MTDTAVGGGPVLRLSDGRGGQMQFPVRPRLQANNGDFLRDMAIAGHGIILTPTFIVWQAVALGELVPVLRDADRRSLADIERGIADLGFTQPTPIQQAALPPALAGALLVGLEPRGRGAVVLFAQEPAFRLFWRAKLPLFLNTVMLGPSLNEAGWLSGR